MLELLQIVLLAWHLICMNVAAGAPLLMIWLEWRSAAREPLARRANEYLAAGSVWSLLLGAVLGGLLGMTLWTADYSAIWLTRLYSKFYWGLWELLFSLLLLTGCWLWRARQSGESRGGAIGRTILAALAATNLLYHFPPLFLIAARLADTATHEQIPAVMFTRKEYWAELAAGETPALSVHFLLASLAMAGLMLLAFALRAGRQGTAAADVARYAAWGGRVALAASLLQLPVGLWVLTTVPAATQGRLMGDNALTTTAFALSLLAVFWLLRELAAIAMGETERRQLLRSMGLMTLVVLLMTASHHLARGKLTKPLSDVRSQKR